MKNTFILWKSFNTLKNIFLNSSGGKQIGVKNIIIHGNIPIGKSIKVII
jgi:hypothetical protein